VAVFYRLQQFWLIVTARPLPEAAQREISTVLSQAEAQLFRTLSLSDQWHSYRVWQTLRAAGHHQPDLAVAALLHDLGKTRLKLTLLDRTLIVLAEALWPQRAAVWGEGDANSWRRPFVVKKYHPQWSAALVEQAGSRPLAQELIRRHQDAVPATAMDETAVLLRLLQWADDQN
jgi:hypothetical protein